MKTIRSITGIGSSLQNFIMCIRRFAHETGVQGVSVVMIYLVLRPGWKRELSGPRPLPGTQRNPNRGDWRPLRIFRKKPTESYPAFICCPAPKFCCALVKLTEWKRETRPSVGTYDAVCVPSSPGCSVSEATLEKASQWPDRL